MATLTVVRDEGALAEAAAGRLTSLVEQATAERGSAVVSLTGGSTPRRLYALLGDATQPWRTRIDWSRLHLFWGDERHVPPDQADSNYGMARAALLDQVPVPPAHVHRMRGEIANAADAARAYEEELHDGFASAGRTDRTFDLMLLGLGEDAHIASIFPQSELLRRPVKGRPTPDEDGRTLPEDVGRPLMGRLVAAVRAPHLDAWRITLTPPAILDARAILMVVAGSKKADAVRAAIEAPLDVARRPAQLLRAADDRVEWILDQAAASRLTRL
jgi:6-phosphogluconolactonase